MPTVVLAGGFDDLRSRQVRLLEEAGRLGDVQVQLWPDAVIEATTGIPPRFPFAERRYLLESIRYVSEVVGSPVRQDPDSIDLSAVQSSSVCWVVEGQAATDRKARFCDLTGIRLISIEESRLTEIPSLPSPMRNDSSGGPRAVVTGCFDWLHSGHVRFFEEAAAFGGLFVVVGHDANLRLLKGPGHPLFRQEERCYLVAAIRFVESALISTGSGWMDSVEEIARIAPTYYVVNEDGDRPEKRAFCRGHHIEYVVLKRAPREGLPRRESSQLRGF